MPVYSHSKLATYETCPQQYKFRYINSIQPPEVEEGFETFLNSWLQEILEKLSQRIIFMNIITIENLFNHL